MGTDRDYADKSWLKDEPDDSFQFVAPEVALSVFLLGLVVGYVFRGFL